MQIRLQEQELGADGKVEKCNKAFPSEEGSELTILDPLRLIPGLSGWVFVQGSRPQR